MKKFIIGLLTTVSLVLLSACGADTLDGDYSGTYGFGESELAATMEFDGDGESVVWNDGNGTAPGTYEIDNDEIIIDLNGFNLTADLADNRESFTVTSDTTGVITGNTFTKKEK